MSTLKVSPSPRDLSLLRFLSFTPATTTLLLRVSGALDGDPFTNERRLRERLQELRLAGFVRAWTAAHAGGGSQRAGIGPLRGLSPRSPVSVLFVTQKSAKCNHY